MKKYQVVYADPPWPEVSPDICKKKGRISASKHYNCMTADEILNMRKFILPICDKNCALFLWSTPRHLPLALNVVSAWGFEFVVVGFTWVKLNKNSGTPFFGMGHYTRSNAEFCLFGRIGRPKVVSHCVSSAIISNREIHSKKPDVARKRIEELFGPVNRLELFARNKYEGWDVWGDQVQSDINLFQS